MNNGFTQMSRTIANRYTEDGFWDIYLGLMVLAFGLGILLDLSYLAGIMAAIGFAMHRFGKRMVTYPRALYVKLRKTKKRAITSFFSGVFIFGLMVFFLFTLGMNNSITDLLHENMLTIIAVIWGGATTLAGLSFNVPRFFAYAVVLFLAVFFSERVGGLGLNLTITGALVILTGLAVMLRFIRKYPIHSRQD